MIEDVLLNTEFDKGRRANPRIKNSELIMGQYAGVDSSDKLNEKADSYVWGKHMVDATPYGRLFLGDDAK